MELKFTKTDAAAITPKYQTSGAACFDLHAIYGGEVKSRSSFNFRTGLAFEVPEGHVMLIYSRSGHGFKNGLRCVNSVGVVDSDYRGEVGVKLHNDSPLDYIFEGGDRIAQAMIVPVIQAELLLVDELSTTERGTNGFGSTGQ